MSSREELIEILMNRDDITREEAIEMIDECRQAIMEGDSADPIEEMLGLEPNYLFTIL